jgi:hypothetical protein
MAGFFAQHLLFLMYWSPVVYPGRVMGAPPQNRKFFKKNVIYGQNSIEK